MSSTTRIAVPHRLAVLATLAGLLEKLERAPAAPDADQYRTVVQRLSAELQAVEQDEPLRQLLGVFPAAAQLYENLQYAHAGLCRSPLDAALDAEQAARDCLQRVARGSLH